MTRKVGAIWNITVGSILMALLLILLGFAVLAKDETFTAVLARIFRIPFAFVNALILGPLNLVINNILLAGSQNIAQLTQKINDFISQADELAPGDVDVILTIVIPSYNPGIKESQFTIVEFNEYLHKYWIEDTTASVYQQLAALFVMDELANAYIDAGWTTIDPITIDKTNDIGDIPVPNTEFYVTYSEAQWTLFQESLGGATGIANGEDHFLYEYISSTNLFDDKIAVALVEKLDEIEAQLEAGNPYHLTDTNPTPGDQPGNLTFTVTIISAIDPIKLTLDADSLYFLAVRLGPVSKTIIVLTIGLMIIPFPIVIAANAFSINKWAKPGITNLAGITGLIFCGLVGGILVMVDGGKVIALDAFEKAMREHIEHEDKKNAGKGMTKFDKFNEAQLIHELELANQAIKDAESQKIPKDATYKIK